MKKIFYYIIAVVMIVYLAIVPAVAADEGGESFDGGDVVTEVYETVYETVGETAGETGGASPSPTETEGEETTPHQSAEQITSDAASATESVFSPEGEGYESEVESGGDIEEASEDIAAIIEGADSKLDAIFAIASAMGITPEEAEVFLDKMVSLGDEHFGESDLWADVKASIAEDPEAWTVAALVVLMLMVLVIFIIRGLIKNTIAQSATKANITDIKTVLGINKDTGKSETLDGLKADILGIKKNTERLEAENAELKADLELQSAAIIQAVGEVLDAVRSEDAKLDVIEGETAASVKINGEQALQIVQLLNIAMGRQMPRMSETTRKAWYDESVTKIKEAAGIKEPTEVGK